MKEADSADVKVLLNFYSLIDRQIQVIETATGEKVDFDPLQNLDEDVRRKVKATCELYAKVTEDEDFKNMLKAIREAVEGTDNDSELNEFMDDAKIGRNKEEKDDEIEIKDYKTAYLLLDEINYKDSEHYQITRDFIEKPEIMFKHLFNEK